MNPLALGLLLILFARLVYERFAPDVTVAGAAALFMIFGLVLPTEEVLAAFANPARHRLSGVSAHGTGQAD